MEGGTLIRFAGKELINKKSYFLPSQDTVGRIRYVEGQLTINNKLIKMIILIGSTNNF